MERIIGFLVAGAFGALVKDIVQDGKISLPKLKDGDIILGCFGGMIIGAFVGIAVDSSFLTAALSGYVGTSAIKHLLPPDTILSSLKKKPDS